MIILIIIIAVLLILIPLYCCLALSNSEDRTQEDELQMEFIKNWKKRKSSQ